MFLQFTKKFLLIIILVCNCLHGQLTTQLENTDIQRLNQFFKLAYNLSAKPIYNTFLIANECIKKNIEGDFVECGVGAGAQVAAMAYACEKNNCIKRIHLFDSFQGIPLAGPNDTEQPGIGKIQHNVHVNNLNDLLITTGIAAHSVENVKTNLKKWGILLDNLIFHKGWFQFTIPVKADKIDKICFLRLDGDLYESTKICLEYLYPKISKGGYVVVDDYNLAGCRRAVHEYLDKHHLMPSIIPIEMERINGDIGPVYWQIK